LKIHEYQGKTVLAGYGVPVPKGKVAYKVAEAVEAARELGLPVVVKAQIHAGGRGKGGGVKLARTIEDVEQISKAMLGMTLKTHQTGPEGRVVRRLLIEQGVDLEGAREMYLAVIVDRASGAPVFMASAQGGMDIEEVPRDPQAILKETSTRAWASRRFRPARSGSARRPHARDGRVSCRASTGRSGTARRCSRSTRCSHPEERRRAGTRARSPSTTTRSTATRTCASSATKARRIPSRSRPPSSA
jgi:hypothetical protein